MPMIEFFLPYSYFAPLRFAQWDQVLRMPAPDGELLTTRAMWHFARGVSFATTGKIDQAKREQKLFDDTVKTIPAETPYDLNSAASVLQVAARVLDARIAWVAGDRAKAIESWRGAVAAQDALNYAEPPDWYYPVRESLAAALFLTGDASGAEKVFREDLKNNPRNGRSLFGLMESLREQGKQDAARFVESEFKAAWKKAEVQLKMKDL
jgi:tetratricopeptide (TPR) repeat protein